MPRRRVAAEASNPTRSQVWERHPVEFMNHVMVKVAKKIRCKSIVYGALEIIAKTSWQSGIVRKALEAVHYGQVKARRVGGATKCLSVRPNRRQALSMRWLVDAARKRGEKSMAQRLANELLEACEGKGSAVKKREDVHRMAGSGYRAFSHYRF